MEFISSDLGPHPRGHYSQPVVANGFVFVAGQLPLVAEGNGAIPVRIEAQTRQAFHPRRITDDRAHRKLFCIHKSVERVAQVYQKIFFREFVCGECFGSFSLHEGIKPHLPFCVLWAGQIGIPHKLLGEIEEAGSLISAILGKNTAKECFIEILRGGLTMSW